LYAAAGTVEHHVIAHINADMGYRPGAVVSPGEENNVAGFGFGGADLRALVENALRGRSAYEKRA